MSKPKVLIVGAGKVGSVLARALYSQGYELVGIVSRTLDSARELAKQFGVKAGTEAADFTKEANLVLFTTPDRYIGKVVEELAKESGFMPGQVVIHTSGCLPTEILKPAREQGAFIGCMHPLQSFANKELSIEALSGVYFSLSGQAEMIAAGRKIVEDFGGNSFVMLDKDRALYHAGACIVSNYTVSLMHWASQLYSSFGLSREDASRALLPLLQGTVNQIRAMGPIQALTGPISRGDSITIEAHLQVLEKDEEKKLYQSLGLYTLGVALEKGTIDKMQTNSMAELLKMKLKEKEDEQQ